MRNHSEKFRDMARSALPSSARKGARDNKRNLKQRARRASNAAVRDWKTFDDPYEFEGFTVDNLNRFGGWDNMAQIVYDRRGADKLSVVRWARRLLETKYAHVRDPDERYNLFKNLMPDTTAGRHILGHIGQECWPERENRHHYGIDSFRWIDENGFYDRAGRRRYQERRDERAGRLEKLRKILEFPSAHKRFNERIKARHVSGHTRFTGTRYEKHTCKDCEDPRTLLGAHDVEAWLDHAMATRYRHHNANLTILDEWEGAEAPPVHR